MALEITYRPLSALKPFPKNARLHLRRQVAQIAESIRNFGFNNPILIDDGGEIIAGHGAPSRHRSLVWSSFRPLS